MGTLGWIVAIGLLIVAFVLWIYCLFDVVVRKDKGVGGKVAWALALVVLPPVGIVAYLAFARSRADDNEIAVTERS